MTTTTPIAPSPVITDVKYNVAAGYLRASLVALVVAHHSMLAYHPYAPDQPVSSLSAVPRWWQAFPIVDSHRWAGFSLLVGFNDVFFMSLLFFLSGLFVWQGLQGKGTVAFLRGRLLRLGLPFVVAAVFLAPLAYYPTYLETKSHAGVVQFLREWISLGQWPAGPAWFIWVLLVFDCVAAVLFALAPRWRMPQAASRTPAVFFALVIAVSAITYIPVDVYKRQALDWPPQVRVRRAASA